MTVSYSRYKGKFLKHWAGVTRSAAGTNPGQRGHSAPAGNCRRFWPHRSSFWPSTGRGTLDDTRRTRSAPPGSAPGHGARWPAPDPTSVGGLVLAPSVIRSAPHPRDPTGQTPRRPWTWTGNRNAPAAGYPPGWGWSWWGAACRSARSGRTCTRCPWVPRRRGCCYKNN